MVAKDGVRPPTKPALAATARARSSFRKWLEAHGTRERKARRRIPELAELAKTLRRSLPRTAEPWEQAGVEVVFGSRDRVALRRYPPFTSAGKPRAPMPKREAERVSALVRAVRMEDAARHPDRGPCVSLLVLSSTVRLSLVREYLAFPDDRWHGFTRTEIVRAVREYTRSPYWLPSWA